MGRRSWLPVIVVALVAAGVFARNPLHAPDTTPIRPLVPEADRHQRGKLFLERADSLMVLPQEQDVQILIGNVVFRQGDMFMYCDSARFYTSPALPADSMEAFGNIRMEQGDTLFLYGDYMDYSGTQQLATVYGEGRDVRLINRDVTLTAPILHYSQAMELGYYLNGGKLTDPKNELTSLEGEYAPPTKDANFYRHVVLNGVSDRGDTVRIYTDTLLYNTDTRIALLPVYARIYGADGDITSLNGIYDTGLDLATLLDRSTVHTNRGNTLTGDSLVYDKATGCGEAFGNMVLTDSARQMTIEGDYGFYNELTDSAYCTGRARALEYSQADTLYLHGDVIRTWQTPDSVRMMVANPNVRFWRVDIQGVCDSMTFVDTDTTIRMDYDPVLWSENREIFGNRIILYMNDSTAEKAWLPDFGFMAEQVEGNYFNQLSGKEMIAYFNGEGELRQLDVNGSVQAIMLPEEEDSTINKIANIESSYMVATFAGREIERVKLWDATSGTVTPLYLAKKSLFRLPRFKWLEEERPTGPADIFPRPVIAPVPKEEETPADSGR